MAQFTLYTQSIAKVYIDLSTLDILNDYLGSYGILYLAKGQGVDINNFLHHSKDDKGQAYIDGSIRVNDDTLAYFGYHSTVNEGSYDYVILQRECEHYTSISIFLKDSFMYRRLLVSAIEGYKIDNDTLNVIAEDKNA